MKAILTKKLTVHKVECLLCDKEVKKGDVVFKVFLNGTKEGYICSEHFVCKYKKSKIEMGSRVRLLKDIVHIGPKEKLLMDDVAKKHKIKYCTHEQTGKVIGIRGKKCLVRLNGKTFFSVDKLEYDRNVVKLVAHKKDLIEDWLVEI